MAGTELTFSNAEVRWRDASDWQEVEAALSGAWLHMKGADGRIYTKPAHAVDEIVWAEDEPPEAWAIVR